MTGVGYKILTNNFENSDFAKFNREFLKSDERISLIGKGSMGGKAKGLAFINSVLKKTFSAENFADFEVAIPRFTVICTDVFDVFMRQNNLFETAFSDLPDERIAHSFQNAQLPFSILGDLRSIVNQVNTPLAVRSSSRLEDAMYEPFAGIYGTKMTANNQLDADSRFRKLAEAIKYVYASTFFKSAKDYMKATRHKIEDEKMAVIIQEVVGKRYSDRFYPEISGVARSYNFYAMGRAKPQDGIVNLALGLGKTIVDGGITWNYSPAFPKLNPPFASVNDMLKLTQTRFWAVNMGKPPSYDPMKETEYMIENDLEIANKDQTLKKIASTLDSQSGRLVIGTGPDGARILTFAPVLIFEEPPLNKLIKNLLKISEEALQAPVEVEFAVSLKEKPYRFGFLQVRPMVVSTTEVEITEEEMHAKDILLASENVLGNGIEDSLDHVVFVNPDLFETRLTRQIAGELEEINKILLSKKTNYLLVGFGRWGSSDPWLGIPVNWGQISGTRAIVEATLENINVELSQGSHFFHNLTSFNVPYFSVPISGKYSIDWEWLKKQKTEIQKKYVSCIKLEKPLFIKVDGRTGRGIIKKTV